MKRILPIALLLGLHAAAAAGAPRLVRSEPADGAEGVSPDIGVILLYFDRDMVPEQTLWRSSKGKTPPAKGACFHWRDPRCLEFRIKKLQPGTTYAFQLNTATKRKLRSAGDETPLPVTVVSFRTAGGGKAEPPEVKQPPILIIPDDKPPVKLEVETPIALVPGLEVKVHRTGFLRHIIGSVGAMPQIMGTNWDVAFTGKIEKVKDGRIEQMTCTISKALGQAGTPQLGRPLAQTLCNPGTVVRVTFRPDGSSQVTDPQDKRVSAELSLAVAGSLTPDLWPQGTLTKGQQWSYKGKDVTERLKFVGAQGGQMDFRVEQVVKDPNSGLDVAKIRGTINTSVLWEGTPMNHQGTAELDVAIPLGMLLRSNFAGRAFAQGMGITITSESVNQQVVTLTKQALDAALAKAGDATQPTTRPTDFDGVPLPDGMTPLMAFISSSTPEGTQKALTLIRLGEDVHPRDEKGRTALWWAAAKGNLQVLIPLLDKGAKVNQADKDEGTPPLIAAAERGHVEVVKYLLTPHYKATFTGTMKKDPKTWAEMDNKVWIDAKDKHGQTALFKAAFMKKLDVVQALLKEGADPNIPKNDGITPLMYAAVPGEVEIVKALLAGKADPRAKDNGGRTVLFYAQACENANRDKVVQLIKDALPKE